ncbi:hypothetical protein KA405_01615 [Patescibacteria group bacterium]|nr:hypothetical protein [Patescibacteria group bacterium]
MDTETLQDTMAYLYAKYLHLFGDKLNNNVEGYSSKKQQTFKEKLEKSLIE